MRSFLFFFLLLCYACSPAKRIGRSAEKLVLNDSALLAAHVGISVYEPASGKYWYNYNGEKYFVPASNTKIPTLYAGLKFLGDSLVGFYEGEPKEAYHKERSVIIKPAGDPTLLHPDFQRQPAFEWLYAKTVMEKRALIYTMVEGHDVKRWGSGWAWNDYDAAYMAERSVLPILGNVINIQLRDSALRRRIGGAERQFTAFRTGTSYFDSILNTGAPSSMLSSQQPKISISRSIDNNRFQFNESNRPFRSASLPFVTWNAWTALQVLKDTLGQTPGAAYGTGRAGKYSWESEDSDVAFFNITNWRPVYSQPTDSMLQPMMHYSDNFFAEQTLIAASERAFGIMNEHLLIDSLLKTDFADLPQKPRWVDGSGLSRYNLFSPQDLVAVLHKMQQRFGMDRLRTIMASGNEGTLTNYFKNEAGFIYAKTGTLSGVVALSGFLYTKQNRLLIFSILVNNHNASATAVRRATEKFLRELREKN